MRWSIGNKLALGFGFVALATIADAVMVSKSLMDLNEVTDRIALVTGPTNSEFERLAAEVNGASASLRGVLLARTNEDRDTQMKGWEHSHENIRDALKKLEELSAAWPKVGLSIDLRAVGEHIAEWKTGQEQIAGLVSAKAEGWLDQALDVQLNVAGPAAGKTRAELETLTQETTKAEVAATTLAKGIQQRTWTIVLAVSIVVPIVCGVVGVSLTRSITGRLKRLVDQATEVAKGNLFGTRLADRTGDELSSLGDAVNAMSDSLRDFAQKLATHSMNLAAAGSEISSSAESLRGTVNDQASRMTSVSAAVEEMTQSASSVADNCKRVADEAKATGELAEQGSSAIGETTEGVRQTCDRIGGAASEVKELERRVDAVRGLLGSINDIADQTNLLALNAAIEAARAGEHGRGFAVVADEVRKLADRTTTITAEISSSIGAIREAMQTTARTIEDSVSQASRGAEASRSASERLKSILVSTRSVAGLVESMAQSAREQAQAVDDIRKSIQAANDECQVTRTSTEQSTIAAAEVSAEAERLCAIVQHLKMTRREHERARVPDLRWDHGRVSDISITGARLLVDDKTRPSPGQTMNLILEDPRARAATVQAEVIWASPLAGEGFGVGVRFLKLNPEAEKSVAAWTGGTPVGAH
jgi:methyl-accepting chemotaxis protein